MSQRNPREVLNHLIETCRDGEHGFAHAAELVSDPALKRLFADCAGRRAHAAADLLPHAQRFGGSEATQGTAAASMHRRWMGMRSNVSGHDDRVILAEAQRGDAVTLAAFAEVLQGVLPASVRDLVERQLTEMRETHDELGRTLTEAK